MGNHLHLIVEAEDARSLSRGLQGLSIRLARRVNRELARTGRVFGDRYHAHILKSPREAFQAIRYVLENWAIHAARAGEPPPSGVDPFCSSAWREHGPPLVAQAEWWMLRVGVPRTASRDRGYSA